MHSRARPSRLMLFRLLQRKEAAGLRDWRPSQGEIRGRRRTAANHRSLNGFGFGTGFKIAFASSRVQSQYS
jgi:hypothetical protein